MKFSIIIPVKKINSYILESMHHLQSLDYDDFEVLILPDSEEKHDFYKTRIIATGKIGPAEKRDIGAKEAKGEILAFLDDDAYPRKDWLRNAEMLFKNPKVGAVGGPAVTPVNDNALQKASGRILSGFIGGGGATYRYLPKKRRYVDDFPSVNLFVRRELFLRLGGFDTKYWPGEDTKLCLDIVDSGHKIMYDPNVLVWHHRRELFLPHLKQITSYALHRGFFAKKYPKTSFKLFYFLPTLFVCYLMSVLFFYLMFPGYLLLYLAPLFAYVLMDIVSNPAKDLLVMALAVIGTPITHIAYGIYFVYGLLIEDLKR